MPPRPMPPGRRRHRGDGVARTTAVQPSRVLGKPGDHPVAVRNAVFEARMERVMIGARPVIDRLDGLEAEIGRLLVAVAANPAVARVRDQAEAGIALTVGGGDLEPRGLGFGVGGENLWIGLHGAGNGLDEGLGPGLEP